MSTPKNNISFNTSIFIFAPLVLIFAIYIYSIIKINIHISAIFFILIMILIGIFNILSIFLNKKITLTNNSLYIENGKKKPIKITYLQDFNSIKYHQTFFGKFFNYGTIHILDNNNLLHTVYFINSPQQFYQQCIQKYEAKVQTVRPDYKAQYEA